MPERDIRIRIFIQDENIAALEKMAASLQKAANAEKTLHKEMLKKNKTIKKQKEGVDADGKALDEVNKKTRTWTQQIVKNIGKVLEWAIATGVIFGAIRTLRTSITDIIDVEFAMAGLTKVMQDGERRARTLRSELLALGQQYGELGDEVVDASTEWARLQITTIEIAENAEVALLAQAVAEMQVVDATNYLIASMQQFERTTFQNISTLDQWNELSNRMAVRAQDLAAATARAGSVIHNAGDSMTFLNAMTAALVQATKRSGQEIGNAIRTFGTYTFRLRSVTKLEALGITVRNKATGSLRSFGDIMTQTAIKWDTFTDVQQRVLAQAIAGTRRQNEFLTLMKEFPEVLDAAVIAAESFGSAEKEATILLDTAQKKAEQLRAGMQRLVAEFGNLGPLKALLDVLNGLINALIEYREIVIVAGAVMGVFAAKAIITAIGVSKLAIAIKAAAAAFMAFNPWILAATAAAIAAGVAWHGLRTEVNFTADELVKAAQKEVGTIKGLEARADRLEFLIEKYKELQKAQAAGFGGNLSAALKATGQEIELIGRNIDQNFVFTNKWKESIDAAQAVLNKMVLGTEKESKGRRTVIRMNIDALQRRIRFGEEYLKQLRKTNNEEVAFGKAYDEIMGANTLSLNQKLSATRNMGFVAEGWWRKVAASAGDAKESLDAMKVVVLTLENLFADLQKQVKVIAPVVDFIEFDEIRAQIEALNEDTRHRAVLAELAGATELNSLKLTSDAIGNHIALVSEQIAAYVKAGEEVGKLEKLLNDLQSQLVNVNNRMAETRKEQTGTAIVDALEQQKTAINNTFAAQIKMADGAKDNVKAAELQIQALQQQATAMQTSIWALRLAGIANNELTDDLNALNRQILLEVQVLELLIRPLQAAREKAEALKKAEKAFATASESVSKAVDRNITLMTAYGKTEAEIAKLRVVGAEQQLALARSYKVSAETIREFAEALKDAQIALETTPRTEILQGLNDQRAAMSRQLDLIKALGATDVQIAQQRLMNLRQHREEIESALILESTRKRELLAINKQLADAEVALAIASAEAARAATDAWVKEFERRRDAWARLIGRGLSRKGVLKTLERIQQEMVDRWIRSTFEPIIDRLTKWEFTMLGIDPEQLRLQEESRNKQLQTLRQGANEILMSMKAGGDYTAAAIRSAMQATPMPSGMSNVPEGLAAFGPGFNALGNPRGGDAGGFSAGGTALSLAPFVIGNAEDWLTGRGGGVRFAGAAAGGTIGGILGGPMGAAFGAQIGNSLVSAIQGLGDKLDDNTEALRPRTETLREQIGSQINRGAFGGAASITYHQEFNNNFGFLIPDREGIRTAARLIQQELQTQSVNISVSGG